VLRHETTKEPGTQAAANLTMRLEVHGPNYFPFLTELGIEPADNLAEQAIRFVLIDRRITQGTRGECGDRSCERIWTVMAACSQQGRSVFTYLEAAVTTWFSGEEAPSLLQREV
jgi:transposase